MKIEVQEKKLPKTFIPHTISIDIENEEDLHIIFTLFNSDAARIHDKILYSFDKNCDSIFISDIIYKMWCSIRDVAKNNGMSWKP